MVFKLVQDDDEESYMRKLETIKMELYERIRAQVADRLGQQDREIQKSEKTFVQFFSRDWKKSSESQLQKQIESSDLIFWGDFHGVRQFQNNLVRWLKKQSPAQDLIVALECLPSKAQKYVDLYLANHITEGEFLKKVRWDQIWGFPWTHYKPLFDWAREHKQELRVINGPSTQSQSRRREKWGLELLLKLRQEFPQSKIFVLYGEYHLLPQGFPFLLKKIKSIQPLFVFQNSDSLYFKKSKPLQQKAEGAILRSSPLFYCIQNVSPWVKWQNYNLFLEASQDLDLEENFDLTEHVLGLSQILSKTLEISLDPNCYAVFTSGDRVLWEHLKKLPDEKFKFFKGLIGAHISFVYDSGDWAFLARISANETSSLAMQALIFQLNSKLRWSQDDLRWDLLIWIHAFSYFGSKLINPYRKTATLIELQKKSRSLSGGAVQRQAARLVVNYNLHHSLGADLGTQDVFTSGLADQVKFQAIKWIAGLWGEKIYNAYNQKKISGENIKVILRKDSKDKNFREVIQNFYELIDNL